MKTVDLFVWEKVRKIKHLLKSNNFKRINSWKHEDDFSCYYYYFYQKGDHFTVQFKIYFENDEEFKYANLDFSFGLTNINFKRIDNIEEFERLIVDITNSRINELKDIKFIFKENDKEKIEQLNSYLNLTGYKLDPSSSLYLKNVQNYLFHYQFYHLVYTNNRDEIIGITFYFSDTNQLEKIIINLCFELKISIVDNLSSIEELINYMIEKI